MSNLKQRLKSYKFWLSLGSAIFLILKVIGQNFGFSVDENIFNEIFTAICSLLVLLGIIAPPSSNKKASSDSEVTSSDSGTNSGDEEVNMEENNIVSSDEQVNEIDTKFKLNLLKNNLIFVKSILDNCNSNCDDIREEIGEIIDEVFSCSEEEKTQNCKNLIENQVKNDELDEKIKISVENNIADSNEEKPAFCECGSETISEEEVAEHGKIEPSNQENLDTLNSEDMADFDFADVTIPTESVEPTETMLTEPAPTETASNNGTLSESTADECEQFENIAAATTELSIKTESAEPTETIPTEPTPTKTAPSECALSETTPNNLVESENENRSVVRRSAMAKALHLYLKK